MRDQYAGNFSDVLKFAFLRALAGNDRKLGIAWYYAPGHDGRSDGHHLEWRNEPAWQQIDSHLHSGLLKLPERTIVALESAAIWPKGTRFHSEPIPSSLARADWGARKRAALDGADIVFLDPDNGLGRESLKHATFSEVRLLRKPGRAIAFVTFPGRSMPHDALVQQLHEQLIAQVNAGIVITLRTNVAVPRAVGSRSCVQRQRWLTVVDPDYDLTIRARGFAEALTSIPSVRARLDISE